MASALSAHCSIRRAVLETLETRRLLAVGGGFTNAGITGEYFNNTNLSAPSSFVRKDVRVDFDWGTTMKPGGSVTAGYRDIGTDNYSVRWTGQVIPRFSETYTFKTTSDDGVRLYIKPAGTGTWTTLVDNWTAHGPTDNTATYAMTAGSAYDIKLEYWEQGSGALIRLKWSSPSTPEEVIDPLTQSGTNNPDFTAGFTDIIKGGRNSWNGVDGNPAPSLDANGWPNGNAEYYFQESLLQGLGVDPLMRGKVTFTFSGKATVGIYGNADVSSLVYTHDPGTNITTGSFTIRDNGVNASTISFRNTDRDGNGVVDNLGIYNLKLMRPTAVDGTTSYSTDSLFTQQLKDAMGHFTLIRYQLVANQEVDWTDRTLPTYFNQQWAGGKITNPHYGVGGPTANGTSWEHKILLANETGRDVMFSIPTVASDAYITNLANMIKYGARANGTPYTEPTANPDYPPLNPNLRVYLELANELWNYADPFSTDFYNLNKITAADADANNANFRAINVDNQPLTKDGSGVYNSIWTWRYRKALQRMIDASGAFRTVFGDDAMPGTSTNPRIRPLYEWMYQNVLDSARNPLTWAEQWYNNGDGASPAHVSTPHPINYFLWGGGGATYYDGANANGVTALPANNSFDATVVANGYNPTPGGTEFTFTGAAGIARDSGGDDIPTPLSGSQVGYITDGGQISFNFTVPSNQTSNVYAFVFKAVNRTRSGGSTDTQNFRVFLDDTIDITARTQKQTNGYTPGAYDANHPWTAENVWGQYSDYFYTKSATLAAGSTHKITIKGMSTSGGQTAFIDDVRITSVDKIFADGIPGGTTMGQPIQDVMVSEANWAKAFGLQEVSYEGGWALGGDGGASYVQLNAKFGDSRAVTAQQTLMNYFYQAGSAVNVFGTYGQWPDWFSYYAQQGLLNVGNYPIVQAIDNRANNLPAEATNGVAVPGTLTAANSNLTHNSSGGQITAANGWINWSVIVPGTGSYSLALATSGSGGTAVLLVDNAQIVSGASGGTLNGTVSLTKGFHSIRVRANSGVSFTVSQITVATAAATPAAPTGLAAVAASGTQVNLTWTDNASNESGFRVDRATDSSFTQNLVTNTIASANATSYSDTGLSLTTTYYYRVYAYNGSGNSSYSNAVSATTLSTLVVNIAHGTLVQSNGNLINTEGSPAVGSFGSFNANGGYSFQLPTIPAGRQITSIIFKSGNTDSWYSQSVLAQLPGDVYGLRINNSANLLTSDYGSDTTQPGTKLSTNWFTGTIGATADVDITGWVNSTGYVAGNYLHLRTGTTASESLMNSLNARWWTAAANATLVINTAAVTTVSIDHGTLVQNNGIVGHTEGSPAVGSFGSFNANGGYSFQLPTIPAGQRIASIIFYSGNTDSYYSQSTLAQIPGDVYGLRISSSANLSASDYGSGTSQPGTKLSTNWFTGTVGAMPGVDITGWVNSSGYVAGNYVQLRTGTTASEATISSLGVRWWTATANARLVVTTVPIAYGTFTADGDIGSPGRAGTGYYDPATATYTLSGSGQDIWDYSDQFNYMYKSQSGDAVIVAKVTATQAADGWAKSGVMFRDSTAANAMYAVVELTPENGVAFQWRSSTGGQATGTNITGVTAPRWVKLVRSGNNFTAYYGSDGTTWTQVGTSQSISMASTALAGLAATAHNNTLINTTTFSNVSVGTPVTLNNSGFETGTTSGWSGGGGSYGVNNAAPRSGSYNGYNNGSYSSIFQTVAVQPNTTYTLTVWGRLATAGGSDHAFFVDLGGGNRIRVYITSTSYEQYTIQFTTGASTTSVLLGEEEVHGSNAIAYFDEFVLLRS